MATATMGHDGGISKSRVIRWVGLAAAAATGLFLVTRLTDSVRQAPIAPAYAQSNVSASHCQQFIELAKAKFGPDWKYRLDPRDTTCAQEVQQQWQHEWTTRVPTQPPPPSSTLTIANPMPSPEPAAPVESTSHEPSESQTRNAETYCLNVFALAQAKYGADWTHNLEPGDAARCGGQIRSSVR